MLFYNQVTAFTEGADYMLHPPPGFVPQDEL
jgi:hypothetical protein